jgi:diaminopimelate epimerase
MTHDTRFVKMHGAGNDFLVLDGRVAALPLSVARIQALADRRTGIGWDQLIVLHQSGRADVAMRIYNPDGSEAEACGNATRCVADMLGREARQDRIVIETTAGLLPAERVEEGVCVDMGSPGLFWREIPLAHACDTLHLPLPGDPAAASMGNPHVTLFYETLDGVEPQRDGPALETNPLFPERANIGFAQVLGPGRLRLRVWERGAGLTRACGSGACAALVNAHRRGLTDRRANILLDGGNLLIEWREADDHVLMTGPSVTTFHGIVDLSTYPP